MKILGLMTCYNRKEKTVAAIEQLTKGNPRMDVSFLVVDDNSTDGTREALKAFENVRVLEGNGSLFYTGGMRKAIAQAGNEGDFDWCLLFNDDVDFYPGALERLAFSAREQAPGAIVVGPTCNREGRLSYGGVVKTARIRPKTRIIKGEGGYALCDTFNANCVLIPWEVFLRLPNMDPAYTHSLGDFDYGFAAARAGVPIRADWRYVGVCCDNPPEGTWRDTTLPRAQRMKQKEAPKGLPRREWFHYLHKNYNLVTAVVYSAIPYLRILLGK